MARTRLMVAVVLLACVVFIFVSPALNLPYTALQGSQQAAVRMAMLLAVLHAGAGILLALRPIFHSWRASAVPALPAESLIDITCIRRC